VSAVEGREVTPLSIEAWHELLADVEYVDAVEAMKEHYRAESRRLWPSDIRRATVDDFGRDEWMHRA